MKFGAHQYKKFVAGGHNKFFISECNRYFLKQFRNRNCAEKEKNMIDRCIEIDGIMKYNDFEFSDKGNFIRYPYYNRAVLFDDLQDWRERYKKRDYAVRNNYYFYSLLQIIRHLHDKSIVHLDIKPNNILFSNNPYEYSYYKLFVYDLEFAQIVQADELQYIDSRRGSLSTISPELIKYMKVGKASDIWSLGITYYMIQNNHMPYRYEDITKRNFVPDVDKIITPRMKKNEKKFLFTMLQNDPLKRSTISETIDYMENFIL